MEEASFATRRAHRLREFQEGRGALVFAHLKKCGGMTVQREVLSSLGHPLTHVPEDARWFFNHDDTVSRSIGHGPTDGRASMAAH